MEDNQEPEEIPMDQVLAEIRQMLAPAVADKACDKKETRDQSVPASVVVQAVEDYFLLTPEMRCDLPAADDLSTSVQQRAEQVIHKLARKTENAHISPELEAWLNAHLPAMVEKAVAEYTSRQKGV